MTQKEFYRTQAWRRARRDYIAHRIAADGGMCEVCGQEPGRMVHHKIWLDDVNCNDPEISLNPQNFLYECQTCHNREADPGEHSRAGAGTEQTGKSCETATINWNVVHPPHS